jgi:hypothetical protein
MIFKHYGAALIGLETKSWLTCAGRYAGGDRAAVSTASTAANTACICCRSEHRCPDAVANDRLDALCRSACQLRCQNTASDASKK